MASPPLTPLDVSHSVVCGSMLDASRSAFKHDAYSISDPCDQSSVGTGYDRNNNEWVDGIKAFPSLKKGTRWADEGEDEEPAPTGACFMQTSDEQESASEEDDRDPILFGDFEDDMILARERGMCQAETVPAVTSVDVKPDFYVYETRFFVCSPAVLSVEVCVREEVGLDEHICARMQQKPRKRNCAKAAADWNPSDAEIDTMCAAFATSQMSWCFIDTHTQSGR